MTLDPSLPSNDRMTDTPKRPTSLLVLSFFGSFVSGPILGVALACLAAPKSTLAAGLGMFVFPVSFALGLQAWLGLAIVTAMIQLVRRLTAGEPWRPTGRAIAAVPSGSFAFVPISVGLGLLAGVFIGVLPDTHSLVGTVLLYTSAGAIYGMAVWQLARRGYLPFPEPA